MYRSGDSNQNANWNVNFLYIAS